MNSDRFNPFAEQLENLKQKFAAAKSEQERIVSSLAWFKGFNSKKRSAKLNRYCTALNDEEQQLVNVKSQVMSQASTVVQDEKQASLGFDP